MGKLRKTKTSLAVVENFVKQNNCTLEQLCSCSPRDISSLLSNFCKFLGIKNTFKNRVFANRRVKRLIPLKQRDQDTNKGRQEGTKYDQVAHSYENTDNDMMEIEEKGVEEIQVVQPMDVIDDNIGDIKELEGINDTFDHLRYETGRIEELGLNLTDQSNASEETTPEDEMSFTHVLSIFMERYDNGTDITENSEIRHIAVRNKLESEGISCVMSFKGSRINKMKKFCDFTVIEYAICKHRNCRKYKIIYAVMGDNIKMQLFFKGAKYVNHKEECSYWLKGVERKIAKDRLRKSLPNIVRYEDLMKVDSELFLDGNWQTLRSLPVYQKARSEAFADGDKHRDPVLDLLLRAKEQVAEQRYIQHPDGRTLVYLYSKEQINTLIKKGEKVDAYFDATGSVVRPTQYDMGHRVLYYALVVNVQSKVIPIAELVSSKQDSATIMAFLLQFKHFSRVTCNKSWPMFNTIVTDWSFALMTSVCQAFNDMTLYMYLKICYRFVTHCLDDSRFASAVVIKTCCAHFIKMICRKLATLKYNRNVKNTIVDAVGVLLQCKCMKQLEYQFENVLILLLNPKFDDNVKRAVKQLSSESYMNSDDFFNLSDQDSCFEDDDDETVRGEYITSPFFLHFFKIYDKVLNTVGDCNAETDEETRNQYRSQEFCLYLLKRLMPFVPLWTDILGSGRHSNSNVESWFKILKTEVLNKQTNVKIGRFVELLKNRIKMDLKTVSLQIGRVPKKIKQGVEIKSLVAKEIDNPWNEEGWKRRRGERGFLYKKQLKKLDHN